MAILFAAALLVSVPVILYGIPNGNDLPPHYQFAAAFFDSIKSGTAYPGWSDTVNNGYGSVGVRFYPPLSYYMISVFRAISGNWYDATCLSVVFLFFSGAAGVYFWARERFSSRAAVLAGIVYILMPYHANQIYNGFLFAEFAAASVIPYCFLFASRLLRGGRHGDALGLAVFYALLILTHLPTTVNGSLALLIYCLAGLDRRTVFDRLLKFGAAALAALAASAFYWVRMITEMDLYNISSPQYSSGDFDYRVNFIWARVFPVFGIESSRFDYFLDPMLMVTLFIFLPGLLIHFYAGEPPPPSLAGDSPAEEGEKQHPLYNLLAVVALGVFMATPLSAKLWENLPLLQKTQFPFRWMVIISAGAAVFVAAGMEPVILYFRDKRRRPVALLAGGLLLAGLIFTPTQVMKPSLQYSKKELNLLVEQLKTARTDDGMMPAGAAGAAFTETSDRASTLLSSNAAERRLLVEPAKHGAAQPSTRINMFYFPHWRAYIRDRQTEITKTPGGAMRINVPPEGGEVTLRLEEPPAVKAAYFLSFFCWCAFFCWCVFSICGAFLRRAKK